LGDRILTYDHIYEVKKIGEKLPEDTASAEFIGIAMFSERGTEVFKNEYHKALEDYTIKQFYEAEDIVQASLEDMIQHIINSGYKVEALQVNSGWMEIHTFDNYKYACSIVS